MNERTGGMPVAIESGISLMGLGLSEQPEGSSPIDDDFKAELRAASEVVARDGKSLNILVRWREKEENRDNGRSDCSIFKRTDSDLS